MTATLTPPRIDATPSESAPHEAPQPAPMGLALNGLSLGLMVAGLLATWFVLQTAVFSHLAYDRSQAMLYNELRLVLARGTAPTGPLYLPEIDDSTQTEAKPAQDAAAAAADEPKPEWVPMGAPVAMLSIPSIKMKDVVVVEGTSGAALRTGPGHRRDSKMPGQAGGSVIMGRSASYGGPFGEVHRLALGDDIYVTSGLGKDMQFKVTSVRREGDQIPAIQKGQSRLTLISAEGLPYLPTRSFYVDATLVGEVKPSPTGPRDKVGASEVEMGRDTSAFLDMFLWFLALAATTSASVWAYYRWGRWQTWIVGVPVGLALLTGATSAATLLLPNLQ